MNKETVKKVVLAGLVGVFAILVYPLVVHADEININRTPLGSGTPGQVGVEQAAPVMDGMYHAPQYLPGFPTAATLWPRVVDVDCTKDADVIKCNSYNWAPAMGRGEYLFIRPRVAVKPAPVVAPIVIYKEVPVKKGKE